MDGLQMNLPNILTILRIVILIPFVALFFVQESWAPLTASIIFVIACITDYFDGYLARTLGQSSNLGRFLDPIADKLLIGTTVLMLAGTGRIQGITLIPGVIILCREILVSGLREFLMEIQVSLPVSRLSKWKTAIQMGALGCLVAAPYPHLLFEIGLALFWMAAGLTLITGYDYLKSSLKYLNQR